MSIFAQNCKPLAKALIGKTIKVGEETFEILAAEGYPRTDNEKGIYRPILDMSPGAVFCPQHRGGLLFLIACPDGNAPGGCILVRKVASSSGQTINGPGRVAAALGITKAESVGRLVEAKDSLNLHMK